MGDGKWVAAGLKDTLDSPSSAAIESAVSLEKSLPFHNLFRSIVGRSWVAGFGLTCSHILGRPHIFGFLKLFP
jgi:hypothetical protein